MDEKLLEKLFIWKIINQNVSTCCYNINVCGISKDM